jgi:hypothetical protein
VSGGPTSAAVADFNHDNASDIAVLTGFNGNVSIFLNDGTGGFRAGDTYPNITGFLIVAADFNHDGNMDLAIVNTSPVNPVTLPGSVTLLLGKGDGTFQQGTTISLNTPGVPASVTAADFNSDGVPDLAILVGDIQGSGGRAVDVLLSDGNGSFAAPTAYLLSDFGATKIAAADLNGDGKADLVIAAVGASEIGGRGPGSISILPGNGDGTFQPPISVPFQRTDHAIGLAVGDLNSDGNADLAVSIDRDTPGNPPALSGPPITLLLVYLGHGDFTFAPAAEISVPGSGTTDVADFNGDGKQDVAIAVNAFDKPSATVYVLLGNGDGTFQSAATFLVAPNPVGLSMNVADLNGDSKPDLVLPTSAGGTAVLVILFNTSGTGTESTPLVAPFSPPPGAVVHSPIWVRADASSSAGIAGIVVYVDDQIAYTTLANYVDTTIPLPVGKHQVIVRAWNRKGEFSSYTANTQVTASNAVPWLEVFSPLPTTVPSPIWVRVNASVFSGAGGGLPSHNGFITGTAVYLDNALVSVAGLNFVDQTFAASAGVHKVTVRAWDESGNFSSYDAFITVAP